MGLDFDVNSIRESLEAFKDAALEDLDLYCSTAAASMESYAKEKAPWQNRTGHARQRLQGKSVRSEESWTITLSHGVDYGVYLEQAHEKKYAIIQPTILFKSPEIMSGFENYVNNIASNLP